jgi:hypothetical protein
MGFHNVDVVEPSLNECSLGVERRQEQRAAVREP